ncbi:MAG: GlxA family transcriptional regulator [Acidimicrobiia bacterium]
MIEAAGPLVIFAPQAAVGMSVMIVKDLLSVAAAVASDNGAAPGEVMVASLDGRPVGCFNGTELTVDGAIGDIPNAAVVLVGAFWGSSSRAVTANGELIPWLVKLHANGTTIAAFSTGTFFLAETGLLDGKLATTYRPYVRTFRRRYPRVDLKPERAFTDAGGLLCADGIPSSCDLIIALVERHLGPVVAETLARDFTMGFDRSYSLADLAFDGQKHHGDGRILAAQQWLEHHLDEPVTIANVASWAGMSPRTFHRRFRAAVGETPGGYLRRLRVEAAKDLLADPSYTVAEIARLVGFIDPGAFAATFRRHAGASPQPYRKAHRSR